MEQPKYQLVQKYIQDLISQGTLRPGDRSPSENELAAIFGISRQTARHAITGLVSTGVLSRRRGSGTYVGYKSRRVGVCITYLDTYIFPDIIRGIDSALQSRDTSLVLMASRNDLGLEKNVIESMLVHQLDGMIWEPALTAGRECPDDAVNLVLNSDLPTVLINSPLPCDSVSQVLTRDREGMFCLVEHLLEQGHIHFGGVFCSDMAQGRRRFEGFAARLAAVGINVPFEDVFWYESGDLTDSHNTEFQFRLNEYLKQALADGITAICCYNDQAAQQLLTQCQNSGISVPANLAITGFDAAERLQVPHSSLDCPLLTSVVHPCAELGITAVNELFKLIEGDEPRSIEMPVSPVYGRSTERCLRL